MADSYRLAVLKALTDHLAAAHVDDGYNFTLAGAVFRGRGRFGDSDPDTMVSILENPRPDFGSFAAENGSVRGEKWPLLIQGWTADDATNPSDPVYGLLDDVERRLGRLIVCSEHTGNPMYPSEYLLGRKITSLDLSPGVVRPPTDGISSRCFFYLALRVGLAVEFG